MLLVLLLAASLVSVEGLRIGACWGYDVLCTTADYQFLRYNESVWAGIQVNRGFFDDRETAPLHGYLKGTNSKGMKIKSSGVVLVSISVSSQFENYIMLPEELWDNPPTPSDPQVFIARFPMMNVFARISRGLVFSEVGDFNRTLVEQNVHVDNTKFFLSYCTGWQIWFVATGEFDCPAP